MTLIPQGPQLLGVTDDGGLDIRLCAIVCAVWTACSPCRCCSRCPDSPPAAGLPRSGVLAAYRKLLSDIAVLWRTDRNLLRFLVASAVFRDGLTGVFTFGAVIAPRGVRASATARC